MSYEILFSSLIVFYIIIVYMESCELFIRNKIDSILPFS